MINPNAVFEIKPTYKPKPVLIRIRATQKEVAARPCSNGFSLVNGDFIHHKHAEVVRLMEES
jgi:hypothetical protein